MAILILSVLIAGCSTIEKGISKLPKLPGVGEEETSSMFGGKGTITASILNPKDSSSVYSSYPLKPLVRIANMGGSESEGQVCISGLDSETFSGFSGCDCQTFQQNKIENAFEPIDLEFGPYSIRGETGSREYSITSITRYRYSTQIRTSICIVKDIYETENCNANVIEATSGPLRISSVEEEIIPVQDNVVNIIFRIKASKDSEGSIWNYDKVYEQCVPSSPEREQDRKIKAQVKQFPVQGMIACSDAALNEDDEIDIVCEAKDVRLFDSSGNYLFGEDYRPEAIFELEYGFEARQSAKFFLK